MSMSIKDFLYQINELRCENEGLREQVNQLLTQNAWFMSQIDGLQKEYGDCYYSYSQCSLEMYNLKQYVHQLTLPFETKQEASPCSAPQESVVATNMMQEDQQGMMEADLESYARERHETHQQQHMSSLFLKETNSLLLHYKTQLDLQTQKTTEFEEQTRALNSEIMSYKSKLSQEKMQSASLRKKIKECQDDLTDKDAQVQNQKSTIHRLQNTNITLTEKFAVTEGLYKEAKKEVGVATDLFNELSTKCGQLKTNHAATLKELNQAVLERDSTINSLRVSNNKMVKRAVDLAKKVEMLTNNSNVKVTFQVDKATTEEVMREGYSDLQKFLETKALQMEHILALVAYALTHLKFVIERYVTERVAPSVGNVSAVCDFFNQVINQITRIFLIIPVPIMLRNIDRLTELASEQCVSMKALHMIQYLLPQTVEEAQASRQRVILESFPELSDFFTRAQTTDDDTVCMSVTGFMMLIGISK